MPKKMKGTKIKLEFTIPDENPQKEIIARKFRELMDALSKENKNDQTA
jgi:hypothetical protein